MFKKELQPEIKKEEMKEVKEMFAEVKKEATKPKLIKKPVDKQPVVKSILMQAKEIDKVLDGLERPDYQNLLFLFKAVDYHAIVKEVLLLKKELFAAQVKNVCENRPFFSKSRITSTIDALREELKNL